MKLLTWLFFQDLLQNGGEDCLHDCNYQEGKCDWCGTDGWCCRINSVGNGCDGSFGGPGSHQCALKPSKYMSFWI